MKHFKKIIEEIIHANSYWSYKHDRFEKSNGEMGDYYYGETPGFAMTVPILPDGRLVLTRQHRYLEQKESIEFPGGGLRGDEPVAEAAKRELFEETGCEAGEIIKVGVFQPANGLIRDQAHIFLAYIIKQNEPEPDETEEIEVIYRRPDEVDEMVRNNEIWDGETMAAWALVHHHFLHK